MKRYRGVLIFLAIALLALAGAVWYYNRMLGYLCLGAAGFVTLIVFLLLKEKSDKHVVYEQKRIDMKGAQRAAGR